MAKEIIPTPEQMRQLLRYDQTTGKLYWLPRGLEMFTAGAYSAERNCKIWNARYSGKEAGRSTDRYSLITIHKRTYYVHRVVWAISNNEWPKLVDHVNGDVRDNRLCNLRMATYAENSKNSKTPITNTSGCIGVYWNKRRRKWLAQIKNDRKSIHLGYFDCQEDAIIARKCAEANLDFHQNHGRT